MTSQAVSELEATPKKRMTEAKRSMLVSTASSNFSKTASSAEHDTFSADDVHSIIRSYIASMETAVSEVHADIQQYSKWLFEEMRVGRRLYRCNHNSQESDYPAAYPPELIGV